MRGLLAQSVKELNESQWIFFRYAVLEIVHCKYAYEALLEGLEHHELSDIAQTYREFLPDLINSILNLREGYIQSAVNSGLNSKEFKQELQLLQARLLGEGKSPEEIETNQNQATTQKETEIREICEQNISASLGEFAKADEIIDRLSGNASVEDPDVILQNE